MDYKLKKILKNWRVVTLIILMVLAVIAIHPTFSERGPSIRSVLKNSSAELAGIHPPKPNMPPLAKEYLVAVNNVKVETLAGYESIIQGIQPNTKLTVQTNRGSYILTAKPIAKTIVLNETELIVVNETVDNKTASKTILVNKTETIVVGTEDLGLRLGATPRTNLRKGLDLQGGTRVLLKPEEEISKETMDLLLANMGQRLNVFGLSDVILRAAGDLSGGQYIVVEIAGANEEEVKELLARQGKFEAKIQNGTIFKGGSDITYVCRSADCSGIDPSSGCGSIGDGRWSCRFRFSISLNPEAAQRQADATGKLDIVKVDEQGAPVSRDNQYLSEKLYLFLDDQLVDSLNIGAELKGRAVTEISISGAGLGATETLAVQDALENMRRLQTILITGSLPVKLSIMKTDSISPFFGPEFISNAWFVGVLAVLAVTAILFARYKKIKIAIPLFITLISEVTLLLGFAAIVGWNLDLASIAGIIIVIGTSVDHQIIIVDETLKKEQQFMNWKAKLKNAFFIIIGAYLTSVFAMMPLLFAGAGLIKGFALTTIAGASIGVFITRPAFAAIIEVLLQEDA